MPTSVRCDTCQEALQELAKLDHVTFAVWEVKMDNLTKKNQPDRSKINMSESFEVKYWLKALGVSRNELQRAVDKVGNSAAAVRKELAA